MNEENIKDLWQSFNEAPEKMLLQIQKNTKEIAGLKMNHWLSSMVPLKIFALAIGLAWVAFLDILIVNLFFIANPFFLISAIIQVVLTKLAIGIYLYQLILIQQIDITEPILKTQEKLSRLKTSTLWVARMLFLQLPVWTTFYWNQSMLDEGNIFLFIIQGVVTLSFTFLALWLFFNIHIKNKDKKWFRLIFNGREWQPMIRSIELLEQIEAYKKE